MRFNEFLWRKYFSMNGLAHQCGLCVAGVMTGLYFVLSKAYGFPAHQERVFIFLPSQRTQIHNWALNFFSQRTKICLLNCQVQCDVNDWVLNNSVVLTAIPRHVCTCLFINSFLAVTLFFSNSAFHLLRSSLSPSSFLYLL